MGIEGNDVTHALAELIQSSAWMVRVLATVRDTQIPDAWVGAGVLRDLVWGERYGSGFSPEQVRDVDVAYYDPGDLGRANDHQTTARLHERWPQVPWEARNQAAVHTWYPRKFGGGPVEPLTSIHAERLAGRDRATAGAFAAQRRRHQGSRSAAGFGHLAAPQTRSGYRAQQGLEEENRQLRDALARTLGEQRTRNVTGDHGYRSKAIQ